MNAKRVAVVLLVIGAIVAVRFLPIAAWIEGLRTYARDAGVVGYLVFGAVYALACLVPSPAPTILTGVAGATFGVVRGTIVVVIGATIGAAIAFALARTAMRSRIEQRVHRSPRFAALDRAIARGGAKIVFLTRLSPIFPFTWINYAYGVTRVRAVAYIVATLLGIIPGTVAFVYIGAAAATAASGTSSTVKIALQVVGAIATVAVAVIIARIAKREMEESAEL